MRVGIAGTGFMGTTHAKSWAETGAQITGMISEKPEYARELANQYQAKIFTTLEAMLPEIDILDVCVPTHLHYEMVTKAALAGKHILCEKPIARTVEEARAMVAVCRQAGVIFMVGHVVRFAPEYSLAKSMVANRDIGKPALIRLSRCTYKPNKPSDNWYLDPEKSGGMMIDLMIHDFDYARWIAGEVDTIYAKSLNSAKLSRDIDYCLAILKHENDTITHIEGAWAYPPPYFRTNIEITGTKGRIELDSNEASPTEYHFQNNKGPSPEIPVRRRSLKENPHTTQIKAFYNSILNGTAPPVTGEDGLAALQIACAAVQSAEEGIPITLRKLEGASK